MRSRTSRVLCALLFIVLCSCGGDTSESNNQNSQNNANNSDVPQRTPAEDRVDFASLNGANFFETRSRYDLTQDGVIDAEDSAELASCVESSDANTRPECDVVPDGELNDADARFIDVLIGRAEAESDENIAVISEGFQELVDAGFAEDIAAFIPDWNRDGSWDEADIAILREILNNDPVPRFDLDGSGRVDRLDVRFLFRNFEEVTGETPAMEFDIDGDGAVNEDDAIFLSNISTMVTNETTGFLDTNFDHQITLEDYCVVSDMTTDANLLATVMELGASEDFLANGSAKTAWCRADGRSIFRFPVGFQTATYMVVIPDNLYVSATSNPSTGWGVADPNAIVYEINSAESERKVEAILLPALSGNEDNAVRLELSGPAPEGNAVLATPAGFFPLSAKRDFEPTALVLEDGSSEFELELLDGVVSPEQAADAAEFATNFNGALTQYGAYLTGCPCSLSATQRGEIVQSLIRMKSCMEGVRSGAEAALSTLEKEHQKLHAEYLMLNRISAMWWEEYSSQLVQIEITNQLWNLVQIELGALEGGLAGVAKEAAGAGVGELVNKASPSSDFFDDSLPSSAVGDTLVGVAKGQAAGLVADPISGGAKSLLESSLNSTLTLGRLVGDKGRGARAAAERFKRGVMGSAGRYEPPGIGAAIKASAGMAINEITGVSRSRAFQSEYAAREALQKYSESFTAIANWRNTIENLDNAIALADQQRDALLGKFAADGCATTVSNEDPCHPVLRGELDDARSELEMKIAAAEAKIAAGKAKLEDSSEGQSCLSGAQAEVLDDYSFSSIDKANFVEQQIREGKVSPELGVDLFNEAVDSITEDATTTSAELELTCLVSGLFNLGDPSGWNDIAAGQREKEMAVDAYEMAVSQALQNYATCSSSGSGCTASTTAAKADPWAAASQCFSCVPDFEMDCPEEAPEDLISIGGRFGLDVDEILTGYVPIYLDEFLHSSPEKSAIPVANDQTTITGFYWNRIYLDPETLDTTMPCTSENVFCSWTTAEAGLYDIVMFDFAEDIPLTDSVNSNQWGVVFETDGNAANNYTPSPDFSRDFFQGADAMYQLTREAGSPLEFSKLTLQNGELTPTQTNARMIVEGSTLGLVAPATETSSAASANIDVRASGFGHRGDFGIQSDDYEGSVWPANDEFHDALRTTFRF